ncbi:MAG TPA: AIR synthase related protein, partial [Candidatus Dormibacteraeota bacterium]
GGEAIFPPFVAGDPRGAGVAAVVANVNDLCAMGARPLAILDTLVAPEPVARLALEGMRHASALYRVPVVGGHLTVRDGPPSLSAFGIGELRGAALSSRNVAVGQAVLLACCLDGTMHAAHPYFSSSAQRGERLADDVLLLPALAEDGVCVAARDVSMAGVLGSLAMLLEPTGCGAAVDLDALPRPPGVPLTAWVVAFPMYAFLLCAAPGAVAECRARFAARDLTCEVIATVDGGGELRVRRGADERVVLDVRREPVTGLRLDEG